MVTLGREDGCEGGLRQLHQALVAKIISLEWGFWKRGNPGGNKYTLARALAIDSGAPTKEGTVRRNWDYYDRHYYDDMGFFALDDWSSRVLKCTLPGPINPTF